jgi:hypothetical protein
MFFHKVLMDVKKQGKGVRLRSPIPSFNNPSQSKVSHSAIEEEELTSSTLQIFLLISPVLKIFLRDEEPQTVGAYS